jgi:hypothetical protein
MSVALRGHENDEISFCILYVCIGKGFLVDGVDFQGESLGMAEMSYYVQIPAAGW